jgi:hypothetical protein
MVEQKQKKTTSAIQSAPEQVLTPNKDGLLFDPRYRLTKASARKIEKLVAYFFT